MADKNSKQMTIQESMEKLVGEVGIFGALSLLHDCFDRNPAQYETYPVVQRELKRFDSELRTSLSEVEDPIDHEVCEELSIKRFETHGIVPLGER